MKHAVLIMAHKNKEQVIRLIHALACDEFDFFVHPDIKWDLSAQDLKDIESCADNVHIASKRIHGELDHWSLPQITLNLIDDALEYERNTGVKYRYFLLLSGQDYPIKSKKYILNFLEEQYPKPLIHIDDYDEEEWVRSKFMLVKWSNKIDEIHNHMKVGIIRKIRVAPLVLCENFEKIVYGSPYYRLKKYNMKLYGGSAWWILPHGVMDYISNVRNNIPGFIREFTRTWTPEETFFQTMTMNSPLINYIVDDDPIYDDDKYDQNCMTYANFFTPQKGFSGHPYYITCEDFDRIMKKKALFARKFDINISERALDMIDEVIRND